MSQKRGERVGEREREKGDMWREEMEGDRQQKARLANNEVKRHKPKQDTAELSWERTLVSQDERAAHAGNAESTTWQHMSSPQPEAWFCTPPLV